MNKLNLLCLGFLLIIVSCTSIEPASVEAKDDQINVIDENQKFSKYLEDEWEKTLNKNPLFATYTGDKRANNKINPNTIEQFNKSKESVLESFNLLQQIDLNKLNEDNKLNLSLIHI